MGIKFTNNQIVKVNKETTRPVGFAFPRGLSFGQQISGSGTVTTTAPQTIVGGQVVIK